MRYIKVSIVPLFLILLIATAIPASASDDFDSWAKKRSGEIDGRWIRAAVREAGVVTTSAPDGTRTISRQSRTIRAGRRSVRSTRPSGKGAVSSTAIDGSRFTKRGGQDFLRQSTSKRNSPSRGTSKLSSPSKAVRSSRSKRRQPSSSETKFRRTTGYSRAGAWRKSPMMGTRTTNSGARRRTSGSSMTRGATRTRRSARTGR